MKYKKMFIGALFFCGVLLIVLCFKFINYLYVIPYEYGKQLWHNIYNEKENIDSIYLGSSHIYSGINPVRMDELNNMNNYNVASGAMQLNGSYYALKEIMKYNNLKSVTLDLFYYMQIGSENSNGSQDAIIRNRRIYDYLKPSFNKLGFLITMSSKEKYLETIFPFIRYREKLFDINYIRENIKNNEKIYNNNFETSEFDNILEAEKKGFMYSDAILEENELLIKQTHVLSNDNVINQDAESYLIKIIELCKKENIELQLIVTPMYPLNMLAVENYDIYYSYIKKIAAKYSVPFYDFNTMKNKYLNIQNLEFYRNSDHLNGKGAELFSEVLWNTISKSQDENQYKFYDSYSEKLKNDESKIYGAYYKNIESDKVEVTIVSNNIEEYEFEISIIGFDDNEYLIQEFSANHVFEISNESCDIIIKSRKIGNVDEIENLILNYNL